MNAECLFRQDKMDQAYDRLQECLKLRSNFAPAYELLSKWYAHRGDDINAKLSEEKSRFYSWLPSWCKHVEFSVENRAIVARLQGEDAFDCVSTTLAGNTTKETTELLAGNTM